MCAWREGRGEGMEGMRAIMHVVANRVKAWKKDWDEVITGRNQFSSFTIKGDSQLVVWPDDDDKLFQDVFKLASFIYDGIDDDPTKGALYYANTSLAKTAGFSGWFVDNIISKPESHPVKATIKNHTFFA